MSTFKKALIVHQNKLIAAGLMIASGSSFAAGNGAEAAFAAVGAQVTTYEGYAWPVILTFTGAVIGIKLFKKFVNKAV